MATLDALSPFQLKDELIRYARDSTTTKAATHKFLNAGRGNPNWIAATPREAFFLLGRFALAEARRTWNERDLAGMPPVTGTAERLRTFLLTVPSTPGSDLLAHALDYGVGALGFDADAFAHELTDGVIGDNYPEPDRMLVHAEQVVHRYLEQTMFDDHPPSGRFDLFAVEGGTAAMCYVFKSLVANRILHRGDTIALGAPIFTPYIELPRLADYAFKTIDINQSATSDGRHTWQYPEHELRKLEDPAIKAFFLVNPSNPASFAIGRETRQQLVDLVQRNRPDLIVVTDDVYGTFADGFRSLAADLPANTILVYSYSKHFGCTGWRLGVIGVYQQNILDERIAALPSSDKRPLPIATER